MDTERSSDMRQIPQKALAARETQEGLKVLSGRTGGRRDETNVRSSPRDESQPEFHPMRTLLIYLSTSLRLGFVNVVRVLIYRACRRVGIYRWLLPQRKAVPLALQIDSTRAAAQAPPMSADRLVLAEADDLLNGRAVFFSVHIQDIGNPPNWLLNPFENKPHPHLGLHWGEIADFSSEVGDIKVVWEMSRFIWAPVFARAWRISGDARYLSTMQLWMEDWWLRNPPNTGPNWMCGQETSIRLINALLALRLAGLERNVVPGLVAFVESHCQRIDFTTFYAVAQSNNHGTSEAAALFVGGTWLARCGQGDVRNRGQRWANKGRKLINSQVHRLVLPDGSFSQHSLTYHRVMLDTLSIAESWRRYLGEAPFDEHLYTRAAAATRWLGAMIDSASGDGPNLGANDGANPFRLSAGDYRDFRPCLQLASLLFLGKAALRDGPWDEPAAWLRVTAEGPVQPSLNESSSAVFPDGGYVVMRNTSGAQVLIRAPTARFRPAHADALHVDLWWKGKNFLRDGGTYSYADGHELAKVLSSAVSHNIEEFDGHDQMPRLSRFLYGAWVRVVGAPSITTSADGQSWSGSYADIWGARLKRTVTLRSNAVSVMDQAQGFKRKAVLRWRLAPGNWSQNATGCASAMGQIIVQSSVPIRRMSLESGWESRHYLEKSKVPVLEVEIGQSPAVLTTTIKMS